MDIRPVDQERRASMIATVAAYFDACNAASRERFAEVLTEGCVHYFPPGVGGPFEGRDAIADLWIGFVSRLGSQWTIDRCVCDGEQLCIEWTHYKPAVSELIRGSEWYEFDGSGKISAIWAHYASPRDPDLPANELEGFPYQSEGYASSAPSLPDGIAAERERNLAAEAGE